MLLVNDHVTLFALLQWYMISNHTVDKVDLVFQLLRHLFETIYGARAIRAIYFFPVYELLLLIYGRDQNVIVKLFGPY